MNSARAEEILKAISTEGSELNRDYREWLNDRMTILVSDLLFYLSTPDKVAETTEVMPDGDAASMLLGVCVGRAKAADMLQSLDRLVVIEPEQIDETFGVEDEKKTEGES